jgi:hypothetical protein
MQIKSQKLNSKIEEALWAYFSNRFLGKLEMTVVPICNLCMYSVWSGYTSALVKTGQ